MRTIIISIPVISYHMEWPVFDGDRCITREGYHFEAKRASGGIPRDMWETYSAFANSDGGVIALGVSEEGGDLTVTGLSDPDGTVKGFWNDVNNPERVSANLLSDSDVVREEHAGRTVVLIRVPRADRRDRPVHLNGNTRNTFRRRGDGDYKCRPDEISSMVSDSLTVPTDRVAVDCLDIGDLDAGTVAEYRGRFASLKRDHPWVALDDGEFLRRIGAAVRTENGTHPTLAGLLMFGNSFDIMSQCPRFFLDYREAGPGDGWDYRITSSDGDWPGNVYGFYTRAIGRLRVAMGRPFALDRAMRRVEESPLDSCAREALVNALVNADYRGRTGVLVEARPDRVTVRNPGTFRIPIDVAEAGGVSDPRNQAVSGMFMMVGAVEHAGSGINRMMAACRSAGVPDPGFEESLDPDMVTVGIPLVGRPAGAEGLDAEVLALMSADGGVSISDMAGRLGVSRSTAARAVERLKASGTVTRVGGNRGRWVVRDGR